MSRNNHCLLGGLDDWISYYWGCTEVWNRKPIALGEKKKVSAWGKTVTSSLIILIMAAKKEPAKALAVGQKKSVNWYRIAIMSHRCFHHPHWSAIGPQRLSYIMISWPSFSLNISWFSKCCVNRNGYWAIGLHNVNEWYSKSNKIHAILHLGWFIILL